MEDLLKKDPVKRVLKALNDFDESLKVETLITLFTDSFSNKFSIQLIIVTICELIISY